MCREEREVTTVLWAHLTDAEIGAISARIVAEIEPVRMSVWGRMIGAEQTRSERDRMRI
jgi:hypothetical protein